ncbi:MAG: sulfite exporter TauE/SafE family protein [Nitrospirota bacterium]
MSQRFYKILLFTIILSILVFISAGTFASTDMTTSQGGTAIAPSAHESTSEIQPGQQETSTKSRMPWWGWPLLLFIVTFILGVLAVLGGVGGGVLFVPIIGGFFPFHIDFVRGAGLLVALAGALAAGPGLLKKGLADLRLAMPVALIASACAIIGAMIGLALPSNIVNTALGATILGIVAIMLIAKKSEYPDVKKADNLSTALRISGVYHEASTGQDINWKIHRTPQGLALFIIIGVMAGMFGLGAGWANVPVLNLLMGAPLKVSVATSKFLLSITDTSAAWIYVNNGAVLPMMVVPSIVGIMLGSIVGVKILAKTKPAAVRYIVIAMLLFAGTRALLKGLGIWK